MLPFFRTKIAAKPAVETKEPLRAVKRRGGRKNRGNNQDKAIEVIPKIEWEGVELKEFKKSFVDTNVYTTASRKYNEDALSKYYADNEVRAAGTPVVGQPGPAAPVKLRAPMVTLPQTSFPVALQNELKKQSFDKPTPIQSIVWPYILSGQNFVGVGSTGSDKILAYVLPLLVHVNDQLVKAKGVKAAPADAKPEDNGPIAVILTHVVKRGDQILAELNKFAPLLNIKTHFIHGVVEEKADDPILLGLNDNPHVVIAVCGPKLNDFVLKKKLNLKQCTFLVFDDASKLAKNARSLENVLGQVRPDRQLIMWTTSFGSNGNAQEAIRHAKKHNFDDYIRLFFGSFSHFCNPNTVKQIVDPFIPEGERDLRFMLTIQTLLTATSLSNTKPQILVFSNTVAKMRKCTGKVTKKKLYWFF
jgi:ATP-dependent RNA helicase DDX5/DBP2